MASRRARDVLERARADLAVGRAWKARDRLAGALDTRADQEILDLLGQVYSGMGDLPAAGAVWFGTRRQGLEVDAALAAWRERHGGDPVQLWRSLPRSVRERPTDQVAALFTEAEVAAAARVPGGRRTRHSAEVRPSERDLSDVVFAAVIFAVLGCAAVGAVTIVRWIS